MAGIAAVERLWGALLGSLGELQLKTVGTFAVHEVCYWGAHLPFLIADYVPYAQRWKIQPDKPNTRALQSHCAWRVLLNHSFLVLPIILLTHPIFDVIGVTSELSALPTIRTLALQVALFFLIEDFVFYWGHRLLHTPFLYRTVHCVHHEHAAPFGIAAEYAHPAEVIGLGVATLAGPMLIGPHLLTLYVYLALRCMQTVECHSGYDFPWSLNRWVPLYGGADFHDHHHRIHSGNYASTFIWVDMLNGTDAAYQAWKHRQRSKSA